ncbi:MAG: hypothetical protein ACRDRK_10885 [Pseudonocardia sp.]
MGGSGVSGDVRPENGPTQQDRHGDGDARRVMSGRAAARSSPPSGVRRGGVGLSAAERGAIESAVLALPPMTEDQVDRVCEVIVSARTRWRRQSGHRRDPG